MDTLGSTNNVQIIKVSWFPIHTISFKATARCVDYVGVHISKCPD